MWRAPRPAQRTQCDAQGCPLPPRPSPGSPEHLLRRSGKASVRLLPDGFPEPALTCPGELTRSHKHTGGLPALRGPPCLCFTPIRIRKVVRIFITFSGLSPAYCAIFVLKLSRRGWWPFRLALHPLGMSPLCFQRWRFLGTGQPGFSWIFSAQPWDPPAQGCLDSKCGHFWFFNYPPVCR